MVRSVVCACNQEFPGQGGVRGFRPDASVDALAGLVAALKGTSSGAAPS